jgi:hypothetical protein
VRFEVFTANGMMITVICNMTPLSWPERYHCLEEPAVSLFREYKSTMWQKVVHGIGNGGHEPKCHVTHWNAVSTVGSILLMVNVIIKEGKR